MEKFKLNLDEQKVMKGDLYLIQGEQGLVNFFKGKYNVVECTAFVTSQRFVACKKRKYFPWGPLIWLFIALTKRKIVFAIPLGSLASIKSASGKSKAFILQASDGQEFKLQSASFFDKRTEWIQAIGAAVSQACPGTRTQESDGLVTFSKR